VKRIIVVLVALLLFAQIVSAQGNRLQLEFTNAYQDWDGFWVLSPESDLVMTVTQYRPFTKLGLHFVDLHAPVGPNYPTAFIMFLPALDDAPGTYRYRHNMGWLWYGDHVFKLEGWSDSHYWPPATVQVRVPLR